MLARWMKNSLATLLASPDKTSNADLVFKVRAADPLLLLVAHALLDDDERLVVLLRVEAQLLEVSDHGGKVGTRVLSEAEVAQNDNMIDGNCESPGKKGGGTPATVGQEKSHLMHSSTSHVFTVDSTTSSSAKICGSRLQRKN